ncbi:MAG: hypothetical protein AAF692_07690, partial [Pseudomonadota bacterium]
MTAATFKDTASRRPSWLSALPDTSSTTWLYALVALLAGLHLNMVLGRAVNWDEFWFYSQVEILGRGEFVKPLQTIHTRFFYWWLPDLPGSEIDKIIVARGFMFLCLMVIAGGIYAMAERFSDHRTALLAVALYLGAGFVVHHGTSFRVDPIVTAFLTTGLAIATRTRLTAPAILALGVMIAFAAMVTIKFVLWFPAFAGIALWRWHDEKWDWRYPLRWIAAGAVALGVFALLYVWHGMDMAGQSANDEAARTLGRSSGKMFGLFHSPYIFIMAKGAVTAIPFTLAMLLVPSMALRAPQPPLRKLALLLLWVPILTPFFYHNSAPYIYTFLLPPVVVSCALTIPLFVKRYNHAFVAAIIALTTLAIWSVDERGVTERQQELVAAVHEVFPEPVSYFDCCGMVGTFTKSNNFLTTWGIEIYRNSGRPLLLETMQAKPVPLLLDNGIFFTPVFEGGELGAIHPDDAVAVGNTFIRFWGDIYVAGRELEAGDAMQWDVLVPGTYTVEGSLSVQGRELADGELITLGRGAVTLSNTGDATARLVWGSNPKRPSYAPSEEYWTGF